VEVVSHLEAVGALSHRSGSSYLYPQISRLIPPLLRSPYRRRFYQTDLKPLMAACNLSLTPCRPAAGFLASAEGAIPSRFISPISARRHPGENMP
jgi:hypothetical protein